MNFRLKFDERAGEAVFYILHIKVKMVRGKVDWSCLLRICCASLTLMVRAADLHVDVLLQYVNLALLHVPNVQFAEQGL